MGLDEFRNALQTTNEVELTTTGRISGRESSRPLWFVQEGERLFLLPLTGSDSSWYKNVKETPAIGLSAAGEEFHANAKTIEDPDGVSDVVARFRAGYGADQVAEYYPKQDAAVEVPLTD